MEQPFVNYFYLGTNSANFEHLICGGFKFSTMAYKHVIAL